MKRVTRGGEAKAAPRTTLMLHAIESAGDPAWEAWKRIYYEAFPVHERMTEGYFLKVLSEKEAGGAAHAHVLVAAPQEDPGDVLCMAYYEVDASLRAGLLWYLATRAGARGAGRGAIVYAEILRRIEHEGGAQLVLFEVEIPEQAASHGAGAGEHASRRIEWYRRQGARLLEGIEYFQRVDAPVAPTPMHLMAHAFTAMSAEDVFATASRLFGSAISRVGPLTLT